jgi:hypothetical protein
MSEELPIRLPPPWVALKPETPLGRMVPLLATVIAIVLMYLARFGLDFEAWNISLKYIDCSVLTLLVFGLPFAWVVNSLLRLANLSPRVRVTTFGILAVGIGCLLGLDDTFRSVIGTGKPEGVTILSDRGFNTPAGGGESYEFVQFRVETEAQFEALMSAQGFQLRQIDEWETRSDAVEDFQRGHHFRLPIDSVTRPRFYGKTGEGDWDRSSLLWDPDRKTAHAKRIRG